MKRASFTLTIAGLLLGSFGLVLFNFGGVPQTTSGAGYSTEWNASKIFTVESSGYFGNIPAQETALGVAAWAVNGEINGISFTETWELPTVNGTVFNPADQTITGPGFNPQEWLFANHVGISGSTPNGGRVTYRVRDLSFLNNSYKYTRGNLRAGGNSVKCSANTDSTCIISTGAYGWHVYHGLSNTGSDRGRIVASGVMMPLKWTVTGNLL